MADVRRKVCGKIRPADSLPDERQDQKSPVIGRDEIVSLALVARLFIGVIAVLYITRAFSSRQ